MPFKQSVGKTCIDALLDSFVNMLTLSRSARLEAQALNKTTASSYSEVGKLADTILVNGNPIQDIKILVFKENIKLVTKGGKVEVDREIRTD